MSVSIKLEEVSLDEPVAAWPFRQSIGSPMWLTTQTRPDIPNSVRVAARHCTGPREIHWKTAFGI